MSIACPGIYKFFPSIPGTRLLTKGTGFVPCLTFKKNTGLQDAQLFVDSHIPIESTSMFSKALI